MACDFAEMGGKRASYPSRFRHVLVVMDVLTKYVLLVPVRSTKAREVIRALHQRVFPQCGVPEVMVVDQQSSLIREELQEYARARGMELLPIPPGSKDKNALPERAIRTFRNQISKAMQGQAWSKWEKYVPLIEKAMRETPNKKSGISPFEYVYGFPPRDDVSLISGPMLNPAQLHRNARDRLHDLREARNKKLVGLLVKRTNGRIRVGDTVLRRQPLRGKNGAPTKLGDNYKEVWKVTGRSNTDENYCTRLFPDPPVQQVLENKQLSKI